MKSDVTMHDGILWERQGEHSFRATVVYSSKEFVHVDGKVVKIETGSGEGSGEPDPFHVTIPAVDLDWGNKGHDGNAITEDTEDRNFVWINDQTNGNFVINAPLEGRDDMYLWTEGFDKYPDMQLSWDASKIDVIADEKLIEGGSLFIPRTTWGASANPKEMAFKVSRNTNSIPDGAFVEILLTRLGNGKTSSGNPSFNSNTSSAKAVTAAAAPSTTHDVINATQVSSSILEPDGLKIQNIDENDSYFRIHPYCFEWQFVHVDNEIVTYYETQKIEGLVLPQEVQGVVLPAGQTRYRWKVDMGSLEKGRTATPTYIPRNMPIPEKKVEATLDLLPFNDASLGIQSRTLEVYRDHLERDYQNFGVKILCGAGTTFKGSSTPIPWYFKRYDKNQEVLRTWNCHGSVWHAYNGTGDGYATDIPTDGFEISTFDDPIQWGTALAGIKRGDIVAFYYYNKSTGNETLHHSHTCMGDASSMYGANNEPTYGLHSRKGSEIWNGGSYKWYVTSSETYYTQVNNHYKLRYPNRPNPLMNRIRVLKKKH